MESFVFHLWLFSLLGVDPAPILKNRSWSQYGKLSRMGMPHYHPVTHKVMKLLRVSTRRFMRTLQTSMVFFRLIQVMSITQNPSKNWLIEKCGNFRMLDSRCCTMKRWCLLIGQRFPSLSKIRIIPHIQEPWLPTNGTTWHNQLSVLLVMKASVWSTSVNTWWTEKLVLLLRVLEIFKEFDLNYEHMPSGIDDISIIMRANQLNPVLKKNCCARSLMRSIQMNYEWPTTYPWS